MLLINIANLIKVRFDDAKQKIYTRDQSTTKHSKFNLLYSMYVINTAKLIKLKSIHVKGSIFLKKIKVRILANRKIPAKHSKFNLLMINIAKIIEVRRRNQRKEGRGKSLKK